ncbi:MAG: hypothetical protein GHCLOJNM_03025 [bacterium]|nr:hypothetical protein [bacterium]
MSCTHGRDLIAELNSPFRATPTRSLTVAVRISGRLHPRKRGSTFLPLPAVGEGWGEGDVTPARIGNYLSISPISAILLVEFSALDTPIARRLSDAPYRPAASPLRATDATTMSSHTVLRAHSTAGPRIPSRPYPNRGFPSPLGSDAAQRKGERIPRRGRNEKGFSFQRVQRGTLDFFAQDATDDNPNFGLWFRCLLDSGDNKVYIRNVVMRGQNMP